MEETIGSHTAVAECAVIGIHCPLRGQVPVALVLTKDAVSEAGKKSLPAELVALARDKLGAVACLRDVLVVSRLPKTRSGKILRKVMRQIADGENWSMPSTIDDPGILEEIDTQFRNAGIGIYKNAP